MVRPAISNFHRMWSILSMEIFEFLQNRYRISFSLYIKCWEFWILNFKFSSKEIFFDRKFRILNSNRIERNYLEYLSRIILHGKFWRTNDELFVKGLYACVVCFLCYCYKRQIICISTRHLYQIFLQMFQVSCLHFINSELKSLFHGVDFILYTLAKFKLIQNFY